MCLANSRFDYFFANSFCPALDMNRDALIRLGEYPKHNRILLLLKELLVVRRFLKQTSDSDFLKIPKMADESKENALVFSRGLAVQAFYCDNLIEFLLASVRAMQITFQYGLSGYSSMAIVAYGIVRYLRVSVFLRWFLLLLLLNLFSPFFSTALSRSLAE